MYARYAGRAWHNGFYAFFSSPDAPATVLCAGALAPGSIEELCFELGAGRGVRYQFDAEAPLEFNLHWHRGNEVLYPLRSGAVQRRAGVFVSERQEAYCLMWTNRTKRPTRLRARVDTTD